MAFNIPGNFTFTFAVLLCSACVAQSGVAVSSDMAALAPSSASGTSLAGTPSAVADPTAEAHRALVAKGRKLFEENCGACHSATAGGASITGPNLYGVIGTVSGTHSDFPYSDALIAAKVTWTEENLDKWIEKPSEFIEGNMMGFYGMPDAQDRAAVISFIRDRSDK